MKPENQNKLKRAVWLAFSASVPVGMGFLHAQIANSLNEDSIMEHVHQEGNTVYMDYVCGRMVKTKVSIADYGTLSIYPETPRGDYQSWATKYKSASELIKAVEDSLT